MRRNKFQFVTKNCFLASEKRNNFDEFRVTSGEKIIEKRGRIIGSLKFIK